jgi:hypothetical protein
MAHDWLRQSTPHNSSSLSHVSTDQHGVSVALEAVVVVEDAEVVVCEVVVEDTVVPEIVVTDAVVPDRVDNVLVSVAVVLDTQVVMLQVVSHWCSFCPPLPNISPGAHSSNIAPTRSRQDAQQSGRIGHDVPVVSVPVVTAVVKEVLVRVVVVPDSEEVSLIVDAVEVVMHAGWTTELSKHHCRSKWWL